MMTSARKRSEGYSTWSRPVCLSVSHISPIERLFILKTLSHSYPAGKRLRLRVIPRTNIATYPAAVSFLSAKCQRVPNNCQQHSALPKTMPTDTANPCCSENSEHHFTATREAWPIYVHVHSHSTKQYVV